MSSFARRDFMAMAGLATAGMMAPDLVAAAVKRPVRYPPGLQLWTVKDDLAKDFAGTLRALGKMGYKRVEAAGWYGKSPDEFRKAVTDAGLECVSAHYSLSDLMKESEDKLAFARDVGVKYVVASSPAPSRPLPEAKSWNHAVAEAMTLENWRSNAEAMDRIGKRAKDMGLRFGYHNHAAEFLNYDGHVPMDEIVRLTDPDSLVLELDIAWIAAAGYDPVEVIGRYASRTHLLHVKDIATKERNPGRIADDQRTVPVGTGTIDWRSVFAAAEKAPIYSYFVEQEPPFAQPPLEGLKKSIEFLGKLSV